MWHLFDPEKIKRVSFTIINGGLVDDNPDFLTKDAYHLQQESSRDKNFRVTFYYKMSYILPLNHVQTHIHAP